VHDEAGYANFLSRLGKDVQLNMEDEAVIEVIGEAKAVVDQ
jgi:hypothetical protein